MTVHGNDESLVVRSKVISPKTIWVMWIIIFFWENICMISLLLYNKYTAIGIIRNVYIHYLKLKKCFTTNTSNMFNIRLIRLNIAIHFYSLCSVCLQEILTKSKLKRWRNKMKVEVDRIPRINTVTFSTMFVLMLVYLWLARFYCV